MVACDVVDAFNPRMVRISPDAVQIDKRFNIGDVTANVLSNLFLHQRVVDAGDRSDVHL